MLRIIEDFCDDILRESAGRANRGKAPLSYRQLKDRWRDSTERQKNRSASSVQRDGAHSDGNQRGGSSARGRGAPRGGGRGGATGRGGMMTKGTAARYQGNAVCFLFNSNNRGRGCPRTPKPGGCDDGKGGLFAHMCNFETGPNQWCLASHPRHSNH